jgi:hypothetical protein
MIMPMAVKQEGSMPTEVLLVEGDTVAHAGIFYRYIGADNDGDGITLTLASQDYANDDDNWGSAELALHYGNTVFVTDGEVTLVEGDTVAHAGIFYRYIGADNDGDGITLTLASQDYANDVDNWGSAELALHYGNTVQVDDKVYRYTGDDDDVNLSQQTYGSLLWEKITPDTRNLGIADYSDTRLWELADGNITARSLAASLPVRCQKILF